ncbi:hypothetical protein [Kitasatospora sp. NPDC093102]
MITQPRPRYVVAGARAHRDVHPLGVPGRGPVGQGGTLQAQQRFDR